MNLIWIIPAEGSGNSLLDMPLNSRVEGMTAAILPIRIAAFCLLTGWRWGYGTS
jgi:hypothetical protein